MSKKVEESLPQTTAERLLKVADIIESNPDVWNQGDWAVIGVAESTEYQKFINGPVITSSGGKLAWSQGRNNHACGTSCCLAGWAVRYTPLDIEIPVNNWDDAGAAALGLSKRLAYYMFSSSFGYDSVEEDYDHVKVAHALRQLAEVDGLRDIPNIESMISAGDTIVEELFANFFDYWNESEDHVTY